MKSFFRIFLWVIGFSLMPYWAMATHNRAGEITYRYLGNLTYEIKIVTYTYSLSPADRPFLEISWGDGGLDTVYRSEQLFLPDNINRNEYLATHKYNAPSIYKISFEDPNRNAGVINIPNSVNVPFYIESELMINPFLGPNNSPQLLNPPIDNACVGQPFIHNAGAYDVDGDSLVYVLTKCKGIAGQDIPGFSNPQSSSSFSLDSRTGDLIWDSPLMQGEYNVSFRIEEYRKGLLIGYVVRDMQITVVACNNKKPVIEDIPDTCILAGTTLKFQVKATDPNPDILQLSASGGVFVLPTNPATFDLKTSSPGLATADFQWKTNCDHIQKNPYSVLFKVVDDGSPVRLVDYKTFNVTVVCPAPTNLTISPVGTQMQLKWSKPACSNGIGYKIYRRSGYYGFVPGHCELGVPAYTGYVLVGTTNSAQDTVFWDNNNGIGLIHGLDYCYMVVEYFEDGAESYASSEVCAELKKDVPVITNVSITKTDQVAGTTYVAWSKPSQIDTVIAPGPYKYFLFRSNAASGLQFSLVDSLDNLNDTTYNDANINTKDFPVWYRVDLYNTDPSHRFLVGASQMATSPYLKLTPADNKVILKAEYTVPWINDTLKAFRYNSASGMFEYVGYSLSNTYTDEGLNNGDQYCYYVQTSGHYSGSGFVNPILNLSQESCTAPIDLEPPCPPVLTVKYDCKLVQNQLAWRNPNHYCSNDAIQYKVYYSTGQNQQFTLLKTINDLSDTSYLHSDIETIAGCYMVTAVDSFMNETNNAIPVCVDIDSCNLYELPNIFTPNEDGKNDLLNPFPYDFVEKVDMIIYNRWGNIEFKTKDPDINWDGKNYLTKLDCPDGVYYYICTVYEQRLSGLKTRTLTGFVHLLR